MKIIVTDNFDRDEVSDTLLCENISKYWGELVIKYLIDKHCSNHSSNYFKLVDDDYKLYIFEY